VARIYFRSWCSGIHKGREALYESSQFHDLFVYGGNEMAVRVGYVDN
jgi:hypothetical protein